MHVKISTTVGNLIFVSMINFMHSSVEHEKVFFVSGPQNWILYGTLDYAFLKFCAIPGGYYHFNNLSAVHVRQHETCLSKDACKIKIISPVVTIITVKNHTV